MYKSGLVTHYTNVNTGKKYNSESCMVHHTHVIMQIKTLSRLQKYQKRFSNNCLIDSNSQTMELKNFVAIMVKSFPSSKIWCVIISINLNEKMIHSGYSVLLNNGLSTKRWLSLYFKWFSLFFKWLFRKKTVQSHQKHPIYFSVFLLENHNNQRIILKEIKVKKKMCSRPVFYST